MAERTHPQANDRVRRGRGADADVMRVDESEVLRALYYAAARHEYSGQTVEQVQQRTANHTAHGRGAQLGLARIRSALAGLRDQGLVNRRRHWGMPYRYWLTDDGQRCGGPS
jgi:hypothetical protein